MGSAQYPPGLPATGANGVTVKDTSGSAEIDGNVANAGTNTGVILNNTVALTGSTKLLSVQNAGVEKFSVNPVGNGTFANAVVAVQLFTATVNSTLTLAGFRNASDAGVDVLVRPQFTRTAGTILAISNVAAGTAVTSFDFNGKQVPASVPTSKTAGAAFVGQAALDSSGTVTISTTAVSTNSVIFLNRTLAGGTPGTLYAALAADITNGVSFIIRSYSSGTTAATTDTSTIQWMIIN